MANNRIQIKRSATTAAPSALLPGELAFSNVTGGSGVLFIGDTSNSTVVAIGGVRNPGVLTANQALVANSTSAIDQVIVGNLSFTGATQTITANGSTGTAGFVLTSSGSSANMYWVNPTTFSVNTSATYNWTNVHTWFSNAQINSTAWAWIGNTTTSPTVSIGNSGAITVGNGTTTQTTSVISIANSTGNVQITPISIRIANSTAATFTANITQITLGTNTQLSANGGVGSAGQALLSNGATGSPYWAAVGTITGVTAGNGLTGGGSSGSVTLDAGAGNGISVSADAIAVLANTSSGLLANTTGVHIKTGSGLGFDGTGNLQVTGSISVTDATVSGNLTVLGDLVSLNVATLSVEDSMITLAKDQSNSASFTDAIDIGFFGTYGNTANAFISGIFRDQSDSGIWKLFASNGTYTNTIIDTANTAAFRLGTLQTFLISGGLTTNSTSANLIANSTYNVGIVSNTITLSGRANNDLLFTDSTGGITGLAINTTAGYVLQTNGTAIVYDWLDGGTF